MPEFLRSFLEQATATGSKSTVLRDLRWFAGIVLTTLLAALHFKAPHWVLVCLAGLVGIVSFVYLGAYVYFALRSPDSLRSEKFTLSKMAIERSVVGDNLAGFIDPTISKRVIELPASTPKKEP